MFKNLKNLIFRRKILQSLKNTKAMQRFLDFPVSALPDEVGDVKGELTEVVIVQACQQYLSPVNQATRNQACLTHFRRKLDILKTHPDTRFPVEIYSPALAGGECRSTLAGSSSCGGQM